MSKLKYPAIDAECARRGISLESMCSHIGVDRRTLYSWRIGKTDMPCSSAIKMAMFFGVSLDYLLGVPNPNTHINQ